MEKEKSDMKPISQMSLAELDRLADGLERRGFTAETSVRLANAYSFMNELEERAHRASL